MYGLKDQYDLAFSIGAACDCSMSLRRAGMQYASFPFDWAGTVVMRSNVDLLVNDFKGMLTLENLEYVGPNDEKQKDIYRDRVNNMLFLHDFPMGVAPADSFAEVAEKYKRRISRFFKLIGESHDILAAYVEIPNGETCPREDVEHAAKRLNERFPRAQVDVICFSQKKGEAFDPSNLERVGDHAYRIAFDFQSAKAENIADERAVASALSAFVKHVRDYRSPKEKRQYRNVHRRKMFELFRAENWLQYVINKMTWKLYKHFKNRLERRGFKFDD